MKRGNKMLYNCKLLNKNYKTTKKFYFMNKDTNGTTAIKQAESIAKEKCYTYNSIVVNPKN